MSLLKCGIAVSSLCFLATLQAATIRAGSDYVYNPETENYYKFHDYRATWFEARDVCKSEGASLIVVENENEANYYKRVLTENNFDQGFVGTRTFFNRNDFRTENGVPLSGVFDRWTDGEPNAWRGEENCMGLWHDQMLNDVSCVQYPNPFMCKKTKTEKDSNEKCNSRYENYFYNKDIGKCYKLHSNKLSWSDAYQICKSEESHLAIINDDQEANYFADLMKQKSSANDILHVGIHNLYGNGFETIFGEKLKYKVWRNVDYDNNYQVETVEDNDVFDRKLNSLEFDSDVETETAGEEKSRQLFVSANSTSESLKKRNILNIPLSGQCGAMNNDGTLSKADCETTKAMYICEHDTYIAPPKNIEDPDALNIHADIKLTMDWS